MNLREIYSDVCIHLGGRIPYAHFFSALTRILRRINIQGEKEEFIKMLTGGTEWAYTIDLDEEVIDEDERVIGEGRWSTEVVWDSINYAIRLPKSYAKILEVYCDNERMTAVPYEVLKAALTADTFGTFDSGDLYYTNISNHLFFNKDYGSSSEALSIKVRVDYSIPSSADDEYTGLPDMAQSMLLNGVLSVIYTQPAFYDDRMLSQYRRMFEEDLLAFNMETLRKEVHEHINPDYTY
jgi:hypothetical protein